MGCPIKKQNTCPSFFLSVEQTTRVVCPSSLSFHELFKVVAHQHLSNPLSSSVRSTLLILFAICIPSTELSLPQMSQVHSLNSGLNFILNNV